MTTSQTNKLPEWYKDVEAIDWSQFGYIYGENTDIPALFKAILLEPEHTAIKAIQTLMGEVEHQD